MNFILNVKFENNKKKIRKNHNTQSRFYISIADQNYGLLIAQIILSHVYFLSSFVSLNSVTIAARLSRLNMTSFERENTLTLV